MTQLPLWAESARDARAFPILEGHHHADVLVIGGGYTGLSASLALAERGVSVILVDANRIGWGASGRNGGQVIPGLKYDPAELIRRYGHVRGEQMIDVSSRNADVVYELISRHNISCEATRKGWIQPSATQAGLTTIHSRARQWKERGVEVSILDRAECANRLGTEAYLGAWHDPRAGGLNPLAYARGLADAAAEAGVSIYEYSPVISLNRQSGKWYSQLENLGTVASQHVVLCTDAYSGTLQKGLAKSLIAANSFQFATRPLTDAEGEHILPGGEVVSDSRRLLLYFRRDGAGRFLIGGRGSFRDPDRDTDFRHLERALYKLYPSLKNVEIEYRWAGRVGITRDAMPHVHQPAPGLTIALGYNGRGIGMATHLGKIIGENLDKESLGEKLPFPITSIKPIPLHGLQRLYMGTTVNYYRMLDYLEK